MRRRQRLGLLDLAQMYWMRRCLTCFGGRQPMSYMLAHEWELYCWAAPKSVWDGYPNLATVTWPG